MWYQSICISSPIHVVFSKFIVVLMNNNSLSLMNANKKKQEQSGSSISVKRGKNH